MVIQRKQWTEDAEEALKAWEAQDTPENAFRVVAFYGKLDLYRIPPRRDVLPADVFPVAFDELYGTVKSLNTRALELAVLVDKLDPEDFQQKVELFMWSFHQLMGAWGCIYHRYNPTDPILKARNRDCYGVFADGYQVLLNTLNSEKLTPVLASAKPVVHEIRESLPRTSTARHWCYLRLKGMVDDAVATQISL